MNIKISLLILVTSFLLINCSSKNDRSAESNQDVKESQGYKIVSSRYGKSYPGNDKKSIPIKIDKVNYFIENSGSMFGYVSTSSNFSSAVVNLSYLPLFDSSNKEFFFINGKGSGMSINSIGTNPESLKNTLNIKGFQSFGNTNYSDLTGMFEKILSYTRNNQISILISDCLYDVGSSENPLTALQFETGKTKQIFRNKISKENIETVIIKVESNFRGRYAYASKAGSINLNQNRPFYILVFGKSELVNELLKDKILTSLPGYQSMAHFFKFDNLKVPYQITSKNIVGSFAFDKSNKNKILNASKNPNNTFQFSFAVDFSNIPLNDQYFIDTGNYLLGQRYSLTNIEKVTSKIHGLPFKPTHLITVKTNKSQFGVLDINLKYTKPGWIKETNALNENNMTKDYTHTYGFEELINAISDAYQYIASNKDLTNFKFEILK